MYAAGRFSKHLLKSSLWEQCHVEETRIFLWHQQMDASYHIGLLSMFSHVTVISSGNRNGFCPVVFRKIWMNLTGLFQGNSCFYVLLLCSVQRSKELSLFHGCRSVSLQYRIANITVLKFLFLRGGKTKSVTPRIISVSGADSVQMCLVLGLSFAQINLSVRGLPCAYSHSPQASRIFPALVNHPPTYTHVNFKRILVGVAFFFFFFFWLILIALKVFSKFAGVCVHTYVSGKSRSSQALILQTL